MSTNRQVAEVTVHLRLSSRQLQAGDVQQKLVKALAHSGIPWSTIQTEPVTPVTRRRILVEVERLEVIRTPIELWVDESYFQEVLGDFDGDDGSDEEVFLKVADTIVCEQLSCLGELDIEGLIKESIKQDLHETTDFSLKAVRVIETEVE